jgi:hypothetical protein
MQANRREYFRYYWIEGTDGMGDLAGVMVSVGIVNFA